MSAVREGGKTPGVSGKRYWREKVSFLNSIWLLKFIKM